MAESSHAKARLRLSPWKSQPLFLLSVSRDVQLPLACAGCGAVATQTEREAHKGREVLVPYCSACGDALLRHGTLRIASALAAVVLVVTVLLTLPGVAPNLGVVSYAAIAVCSGVLPPLVAVLFRPGARDDAQFRQRAVWWNSAGSLVCTQKAWAEQLARENQIALTQAGGRVPRFSALMLSGSVLALILAPTLFTFLHPLTVVLNFGADEVEFWVDGQPRGRLPTTQLETAQAGVRVRIGAGVRTLEFRSAEGQVLATTQAPFEVGKAYLFAPLADGFCFWIERDHYGKSASGTPEREYERLAPGAKLWALPGPIDSWFSKNPDAPPDQRSTGGTLSALRQAPCTETPAEVAP